MASVQWGATGTSALIFNPIGSGLNGIANGAGSLAFLAKPVKSGGGAGCDLGGLRDAASGTSGNWYHSLGESDDSSSNKFWDDDNGSHLGVTTITDSNWYIVVLTWPSGTGVTERLHFKNLTAATAWVHENASGTVTDKAGPGTSTGYFHVGYHGDYNIGNGCQIALAAAWNVELNDTNAALLSTNSKTSDWYNNPAGTPVFLSEITSLTPTDLIGASTFDSTDSVTTNLTVGGDPAGGWTFDGIGGGGGADLNLACIN